MKITPEQQVILNNLVCQRYELATAKPFYDFTCKFMCHEISSLEREREAFFDNFNPDPESV
jgi:hypothetical protein